MAAEDAEKAVSTEEAGKVLVEAIRQNICPRDIITRQSIENAISVIMAVGGSTNAVLHFLAIAHSANIPFTIDDFEPIRAIDADARLLQVNVTDEVLAERRSHWQQPQPRYTSGVLAKYAHLVSSSSLGAVTDLLK